VFDLAVLLAERADAGQEGEIIEVVGGDEVCVPPVHIAGFKICSRFPGACFDEHNELVVRELEHEFILGTERGARFQSTLLERVGDIL
jgi:hypothetical protein